MKHLLWVLVLLPQLAAAVSCYELEAVENAQFLPNMSIQRRQLLAAASALRELEQNGKDPLRTRTLELALHFRNFVEHTRRDLVASGLNSQLVDWFLVPWKAISSQEKTSLIEMGVFVGAVQNFLITFAWHEPGFYELFVRNGIQIQDPRLFEANALWYLRRGGPMLSLPISFPLSFQARSDLMLLGVSPLNFKFTPNLRYSYLDLSVYDMLGDVFHDKGQTEPNYFIWMAYRTQSEVKDALNTLQDVIRRLSVNEQRIAYFVRDQIVSRRAVELRGLDSKPVLTRIVEWLPEVPELTYLAHRYYVVSKNHIHPVTLRSGRWSGPPVLLDFRVPEGGVVGQKVTWRLRGELFPVEGTVVDRREGLLRELGLPSDISWEDLQKLISTTVTKLQTELSLSRPN